MVQRLVIAGLIVLGHLAADATAGSPFPASFSRERYFRPALFSENHWDSYYNRGNSSLDYRRSVYVDYYAPNSWSSTPARYSSSVLYSPRGLDASRGLYSTFPSAPLSQNSAWGSNSSVNQPTYSPTLYSTPAVTYSTGFYYGH